MQYLERFIGLYLFLLSPVADEGLRDAIMVQELGRVAGVLCGDDIDLFEDAQRPQGDVLEVPDGGGDDIQAAGRHLLCAQHFPEPPVGKDDVVHIISGKLPAVFVLSGPLQFYLDRFLRFICWSSGCLLNVKPSFPAAWQGGDSRAKKSMTTEQYRGCH